MPLTKENLPIEGINENNNFDPLVTDFSYKNEFHSNNHFEILEKNKKKEKIEKLKKVINYRRVEKLKEIDVKIHENYFEMGSIEKKIKDKMNCMEVNMVDKFEIDP